MLNKNKNGGDNTIIKLTGISLGLASVLFFGEASALTIGGIADNVTAMISNIAKLVTATAYIAGMGFAVGAILKFKQHKENPTQIPIGTPIMLLGVAAALLFLPAILGIAGESLFGAGAQTGGVGGTDTIQ